MKKASHRVRRERGEYGLTLSELSGLSVKFTHCLAKIVKERHRLR